MSRRLLLLAYYFPPYGSIGSSIRAVKLAKYLPEFGWEPVILTIDDPSGTISQEARLSMAEIPASVKVYKVRTLEPAVGIPTRYADNQSESAALAPGRRLRRALRYVRSLVFIPDNQVVWLPFALSKGLKVIREESIDVILATCPPFSVALVGAMLSYVAGKPLMLDVRDDWLSPQVLAHRPRWIQRIERWQEAWAVERADRVVLVTRHSHEAFCVRYPSQKAKFLYIPNGVDLSELSFDDLETAALCREDGRFTVLHSGSMHGNRSPQSILDAVRIIQEEHPEVSRRLRLIFRGDMLDKYRQMLASPDLRDVIEVAPFLPRNEYISACRRADVLLVIAYDQAPTLIPGKVYEYWALQRPILLLADDGAAKDLVISKKLGEVVSSHEPGAIAQVVLRLFQDFKQGRLAVPNLVGIEEFDRKFLASRLAEALNATV